MLYRLPTCFKCILQCQQKRTANNVRTWMDRPSQYCFHVRGQVWPPKLACHKFEYSTMVRLNIPTPEMLSFPH